MHTLGHPDGHDRAGGSAAMIRARQPMAGPHTAAAAALDMTTATAGPVTCGAGARLGS
jgi:hypothetical protein